ncbi:Calcium/calmodulin-dependent protein kinase type I isoform A, partial [Neolecta irregularis DAH-3]
MAPEIFRKSGHGKPVDVWALGVITYFLLSGMLPFDRDSNAEEMQAILQGEYAFEPGEGTGRAGLGWRADAQDVPGGGGRDPGGQHAEPRVHGRRDGPQ